MPYILNEEVYNIPMEAYWMFSSSYMSCLYQLVFIRDPLAQTNESEGEAWQCKDIWHLEEQKIFYYE